MPGPVSAQGPEFKLIWQVQRTHGDSSELSSRFGGRAVSHPHDPRLDFGPCGCRASVAAWPGVFCPYFTDSVECALGPAGEACGEQRGFVRSVSVRTIDIQKRMT